MLKTAGREVASVTEEKKNRLVKDFNLICNVPICKKNEPSQFYIKIFLFVERAKKSKIYVLVFKCQIFIVSFLSIKFIELESVIFYYFL